MDVENTTPEMSIALMQLLSNMDSSMLQMIVDNENAKLNGDFNNEEAPQPPVDVPKPLELTMPHPQQHGENGPQSSSSNSATESSRSSKSPSPHANVWFECFRGTETEVNGLINTLCVFKKENTSLYECLNRRKFKCQYKFRVHTIQPDVLVCEESGCHSHTSGSTEPQTSQGAPKELKDLVDQSYYENWPTAVRQHAFRAKIVELRLDMKQALRQTDNRLSYIRRTKKLNTSQFSPKAFLPFN